MMLSEEQILEYDAEEALNIRYVRLTFVISFPRDCTLPAHKASALRGGMGQRLLEQNCIRDRGCDRCDFEDDCMVRRIMYAKNRLPVRYGGKGESNGYIIECENTKTRFHQGERLQFRVTLFGRVIPYFSQILQAFYQLGLVGLGKDHAPFEIVRVENDDRKPVVSGTNVFMANYEIKTVLDYAAERVRALGPGDMETEYTMQFPAPAAIKSGGEMIDRFLADPVIRALMRRIYTMDCFEGIDLPLMSWEEHMPEEVSEESRLCNVTRYSSAHESRITLLGLKGEIRLTKVPEEMLLCLTAGEVLHIGSNTSFGFGRYVLERSSE